MRPIPILFGGNLLGAVAGGVFFLAASWNFDLAEMGRYGVAISAQWIAAGLVGTGLSVATVRIATDLLLAGDRRAAAGIVFTALGAAMLVVLAASGAFLAVATIDELRPTGNMLALVALWAGSRSLLDCIRAGLLAQQQFSRVAVLACLSVVTGLGALLLALLRAPLTVEGILGAHVLGLGSSALFGSALLVPLFRSGASVSREGLRELLRYARWPALSEGTRLLQVNMGPLILVALVGAEQAGLFSLGRYPAYLFEVMAVSLYQYWLPTAARAEGPTRLVGFMKRQMKLAAWLGVGIFVVALAFRPLLPWLGENFAAASHLFLLNVVDFALLLLVRPVEASFHGLHRPDLELRLRFIVLPVLCVGALLLASWNGALGMVWAHVVAGVVAAPVALHLLRGALGRDATRVPELPGFGRRR
jgi:O-antigen/teichoic acid export membrane protein